MPSELNKLARSEVFSNYNGIDSYCEEDILLEHWEYELIKKDIEYSSYTIILDTKDVKGFSLSMTTFNSNEELKAYEDFMNNSGWMKAPKIYEIRGNSLIAFSAKAVMHLPYLDELKEDFRRECKRIFNKD